MRFGLESIGTHLDISIDTHHSCNEIFFHIQSYLEGFEKKYSRFIDGNWLHTVNTSRRGVLDTDAKNMLLYMIEIASDTDGYFDPTIAKKLSELGYGVRGTMNSEQGAMVEKGYGDYRDIEIIGDEVFLHGDIILEFGGVGKGYLIDQIRGMIQNSDSRTQKTREERIENFLINFGGDLYGRGGWKVGLESPFASDEVIGTHVLDDGFLACSAGTRRKWGNHHHLINPKTGTSATEVVASYVEGVSGIISDAYATTLCVMPWELACQTLEKTSEISGSIVRYDGTIFQKAGSRSKFFS